MNKKNVTFQDFSLVLNKVNKALSENTFPNTGYAFEYLVLEQLYPELDDVSEFITDGPGDQGIDAVFVEDDNIDIYQFKFTEKFDNCKKDTLSASPINSIEAALKRITAVDQDFLDASNPLLQSSIKDMWHAMEKGRVNITVHFYTNLAEPIQKDRLSQLNKNLLDFGAKAEVYGITDLVSLIIENKASPFDTKFQLESKSWFENVSGGNKYLIGVIDAFSFIEAVTTEEEGLSEDIFYENVRVYLRRKGKINNAIFKTATGDDSSNFFFYNNGITILCDSYDYSKINAPFVNIKDLRIVNGSQTIHALNDVYANLNLRDSLKDVSLLLRVYEVKDKEIGQKIAEFTNSQNPVKSRDLRSNDITQTKLEELLKDIGIFYARKKNQYYGDNIPKDRIIDAEKLGQVLLAFYVEKPGAAKNSKKEIYGKHYDNVFDQDKINTDYILAPYRIFEQINKIISTIKKEKLALAHGSDSTTRTKLIKFVRANDYAFHATYYWLTAVKLLAMRRGVEISVSALPKLEKLIPLARRSVKKLADNHPELTSAELFKSDFAVEELAKIIAQ